MTLLIGAFVITLFNVIMTWAHHRANRGFLGLDIIVFVMIELIALTLLFAALGVGTS